MQILLESYHWFANCTLVTYINTYCVILLDSEQMTPAFWPVEQREESDTRKLMHPSKQLSAPLQSQLLSHCSEPPSPNWESVTALVALPYPSCWQTTLASKISQESSHTVCHTSDPPKRTSTLPAYWSPPPTNRNCVEHVATMHT